MALVKRLVGGLLVWALGFNAIYAAHGLGCGMGWGERVVLGPLTALNLALIPLWLLFLAAAVVVLRNSSRPGDAGNERLLRQAGLIGGWAGIGGIALMGAPALLPAHCL
ncbi:MAG TPA: hypothetical protein VGV17_06660 [Bosea sp. (in: a-proteobacteria)]|jgi:hypothetical protein|uniref:hypothetical protein n=1 Tax=Bosea sp. (in: a-proteobacteria) TaxID=1871050 RepID=UPI002DDD138D|nr:hypothetical protein [Bosea sp. (in: a-proteobacteria)]HEV2553419.1 hypothetical protein [Bosea sp. (in: a-proteobacteria)]